MEVKDENQVGPLEDDDLVSLMLRGDKTLQEGGKADTESLTYSVSALAIIMISDMSEGDDIRKCER